MHQIQVAGQLYYWAHCVTSEFQQLRRWGDQDEIEVLRISSLDREFDIAIRVLVWPSSDGDCRHLGPALVLGDQFPSVCNPVRTGIMIELRPKVCRLPNSGPRSTDVERVIQWCKSVHFRSRRVNSSGGHWVGYGYPTDA